MIINVHILRTSQRVVVPSSTKQLRRYGHVVQTPEWADAARPRAAHRGVRRRARVCFWSNSDHRTGKGWRSYVQSYVESRQRLCEPAAIASVHRSRRQTVCQVCLTQGFC